MNAKEYDVTIVGGGIVGLATAMALTAEYRLSLLIIEAENRIASHQTGHNSGVIHSGLYYKPGSYKARNCVEGREALYRFCQEQGIPHERCGKIVVAVDDSELPALEELERRGTANGLKGLQRLDAQGIRDHEPHCTGIAGLFVPETGIVDFTKVAQAYARLVEQAGGELRLSARLIGCQPDRAGLTLETTRGEIRTRALVNCAGLQCDRVARLCGVEPGLQIVPFRGEYYELIPSRRHLVKNLIYPVPDPRFPFLGVHFTRMIKGGVEAGPNAVLAFRREGYSWASFSVRDTAELLAYSGFWKMAFKYWKTGCGEMYRSLSKKAFCTALQRLLPELTVADLEPAGAGVRAQAVEPTGALVDDFRIVERERMIHVLNAPSPAATASIAIGRTIAEKAARNFDLHLKESKPQSA
ncbi:MAG: hydroxyglutarate oxidase [Gemmatales bacterium]|nr:MAG: hydroxyglutarate oxidase [Gemmatales bacterium]